MEGRMSKHSFGKPGSQSGLSLVELMVATVLGLLIVAALTQLFGNVTKTNREMVKTNSQIENARFAGNRSDEHCPEGTERIR